MVVLPEVEEPKEYNTNYILFFNHVALQLCRLTHSVEGNAPQRGPPVSARALALVHLAINDAYFGVRDVITGRSTTYLSKDHPDPAYRLPPVLGADQPRQAVAGAAITVLTKLYTTPSPRFSPSAIAQLSELLQDEIREENFPGLDALSSSYRFGVAVGNAILNLLEIKPDEPGADQGAYRPTPGKYKHDADPANPLAGHHAPLYGMTAKRIAVQHKVDNKPTEHIIADPPVGFGVNNLPEYTTSLHEVITLGGAPELNATQRTPAQTVEGFYWAYDGANLLSTPPRLYNQILRKIAFERKPDNTTSEDTNADFARLFALANVAMADAGIFSWQEKYCFEFWRPQLGIREDDGPKADPFFLSLGAPNTNSNGASFKPPFPAYPSGHATFGASIFQIVRLYYRKRNGLGFDVNGPDNINFEFVSEELDGVSRDLHQPYDPTKPIKEQQGTVRTRVPRKYPSLWAAIFANAVSRIYLGVHWIFDAAAGVDVREASQQPHQHGITTFKEPHHIRYQTMGTRRDRPGQHFPIGGVPLGLGIANDIFQSDLKPTPPELQPTGRDKCGMAVHKHHKHAQKEEEDKLKVQK